jgi:hypothetical protein
MYEKLYELYEKLSTSHQYLCSENVEMEYPSILTGFLITSAVWFEFKYYSLCTGTNKDDPRKLANKLYFFLNNKYPTEYNTAQTSLE